MALRKITLCIILIMLVFCSFLYLKSDFNPQIVEFLIDHNTDISEIDETLNSIYTLNYNMDYNSHSLVMTTGMDTLTQEIKIKDGEFIASNSHNSNLAVLGDKAANLYFRTNDVVGQKISFFNQEYEIIGIAKNSNTVFISMNDKLTNLSWKKKILKLAIDPSEGNPYSQLSNHTDKLQGLGIRVIDTIIYKEIIYGYLNVICILVLIILFKIIKFIFLSAKNQLVVLWKGYKDEIRTTEFLRYLLKNIKNILHVFSKISLIFLVLLCSKKVISLISIPPSLVPGDMFSLSSYITIVKFEYSTFLFHLRNGFSSILIESIFINITCITVFGCTLFSLRKYMMSNKN